MTKRVVDTSIEELLVSNSPFEYAHLIKFERPFDKDPDSSKFRSNANRYAYFTDASRDISFNDGSTDQDGNANGSQIYRANRVLSVGGYSETTEPRAINVGLTLAGEHLGTSISITGDFGASSFTLDSTFHDDKDRTDLVDFGFREGDKVKITKNSGTFSTGDSAVTYIITGFSNNNLTMALATTGNDSDDDTSFPTDTSVSVTITLESEELKAVLAERAGVNLANPTFLNREVFIHKVFIDPETGDLVGNTSILLFKGIIASCSVSESETSSQVKWNLSSHWADWTAITGRLTTDEVHRALNERGQPDSNATVRPEYAYDLGFLHSETTLNQIANYKTFRTEYVMKSKKRGAFGWGGRKYWQEAVQVEDNNEVDLQIGLQGKYLPVIYGVHRIDGIPVFADTAENASNIVYVAYALCEGEIHGIYNFYIDGVPIICTDQADYDVRSAAAGNSETTQLACYGRASQGDTIGGEDTESYSSGNPQRSTMSAQFQRILRQMQAQGEDAETINAFYANVVEQYEEYYESVDYSSAPTLSPQDAYGLQHSQFLQIPAPNNMSLTFFAGKPNQKASDMLVTQAEGTGSYGRFKRQVDYYDGDLPYWSPNHRLLDTAYVVGAFVIEADQTTVPEVEYTVKGKIFENYNYDNSYLPDTILGSSDVHTNFNEGDDITVERSNDGSTWSTTTVEGDASDSSFRILHKYLLSTNKGTQHYRFILDETPDLDETNGVPAYTYLRLKDSSNNYWHMRTWNHKAVDAANFPLILKNPTAIAVNGSNQIQLTFSSDDATLLRSGYDTEISNGQDGKITYGVFTNNVSSLDYIKDQSIVGSWSGDVLTLSATYDSSIDPNNTAIADITDVLTIQVYKNRNFFFGASNGGALVGFDDNAELTGATITLDQTGESRIIDNYSQGDKRVEIDAPFVTLTEANYDAGLTFSITGNFSDKRAGNNPAMQLLDYLSSSRYGKDLSITDDIDLASFKASAKLCDVRSDQTIYLANGETAPSVGDVYKLTSDGTSSGTHLASGTVTSVSNVTVDGQTAAKVTFNLMSGQFLREYQQYINYQVGEHLVVLDGGNTNVYKNTSAGYKASKPTHTSGTVTGFEYISSNNMTINKVSGSGPASLSVNASAGIVYSLYSADSIKYWRYLGWEHHKQTFVTRHQTNLIVETSKSLFENVNAFLSHFNGVLSYEGGKYVLDVETQVTAPTTSTTFNSVSYDWNVNPEYIDNSDILGSISLTDNSQRFAKNTVKASIFDPQNNFGSRSVSFFDSDYLKADRGIIKTGQSDITAITNYFNARMQVKQSLIQSRYTKEISFRVGPKGLLLKAGQVISINYEPFGFSSKLFRIENLNFNADCTVQVKAREYDNSIYVITAQRAAILRQETATQAAPLKAPGAPTSLSATTTKPGSVILTWTNPTDFVDVSDDIEIWASDDNNRANASLLFISDNETNFTYTTADAGTKYYWVRTRRTAQKGNNKPQIVTSAYHPSGATSGVTGTSKVLSPALLVNVNNIVIRFDADGLLDPSGTAQDVALTVTRQNLTGTPTIEILEPDTSSQSDLLFTDASTSISGTSATVDASTASTSTTPKIVRVSLTEGGDTYTTLIPVGILQQGSIGADGSDGPRTASGYLYYQSASASAPSAPSNSSVTYSFSTGTMSGGVIGTGSTNWNVTAPTFTGGQSSSKYWYVYYTVTESSSGSGSGTPTFDTTVYEGHNFVGLVRFTGTNTVEDGSGGSLSFGSSGTTEIDGGKITTGTISADRITLVGKNISDLTNNSGYVDSSGASAAAPVQSVGGYTGTVSVANLSSAGLYLSSNPSGYVNTSQAAAAAPVQSVAGLTGTVTVANLSSAGLYLSSNPSGYVNTSQAAAAAPVQSVGGYTGTVSVANLSAAGLTLTSSLSDAATTSVATIRSGTTSSDVGLGNVSNYSPSNQVINGWNTTITAGAIKLGNSSGARIELDATSSNPRILIVDAT